MLECERYKMFRGTMTITPIAIPGDKPISPFDVTGTWLYKPEYECWYCKGSSYPERICSIKIDET